MRKENPVQYMINPLVPGPISEGLQRLLRRSSAASSTRTGVLAAELGAITALSKPLGGSSVLVGPLLVSPFGGAKAKVKAEEQLSKHTDVDDILRTIQKESNWTPFNYMLGKMISISSSSQGITKMALLGSARDTMATSTVSLDDYIAAARANKKRYPGHYWLNPMVPGPLQEGIARLMRRTAASSAYSSPRYASNFIPVVGTLINMIRGGPDVRAAARKRYENSGVKGYVEEEEKKDKENDLATTKKEK